MKSKIMSITGYKGQADTNDCFKAVSLLFDEKGTLYLCYGCPQGFPELPAARNLDTERVS